VAPDRGGRGRSEEDGQARPVLLHGGLVRADRMRETGTNSTEMLALADRYGLRGFPTLIVSRPGFDKGITMEGWDGPAAAIEFLKVARQRFLAAEKSDKKKKA
jgi:hypothetical protein